MDIKDTLAIYDLFVAEGIKPRQAIYDTAGASGDSVQDIAFWLFLREHS